MSATETPDKQWRGHLQRSFMAHLALLVALLVYVVVTDALSGLWAMFYQKPPAVIGVTFIDKVPNMPKKVQALPTKPIAQPLKSSQAEVVKKIKMPEMPQQSSQKSAPKKTKPAQVNKPVKAVQRQVSKVSKVTKTSMDRKVNLAQKATEKSSRPSTSKMDSPGKKITQEPIKTKAQVSNAQQIGAKKVIASGKAVVEQTDVQKSLDKVMAKPEKKTEESQEVLEKNKKQAEKRAQADAQRAKEEALKIKQAKLAAEQEKKHLADLEHERKLQHELGVIGQFSQMMIGHIQSHALFNEGMENRQVKLKVQLDLSGHVKSVLLMNSSGEASFDRLAINAVYKASPLPLPEDEAIARKMTVINLTVKPDALH